MPNIFRLDGFSDKTNQFIEERIELLEMKVKLFDFNDTEFYQLSIKNLKFNLLKIPSYQENGGISSKIGYFWSFLELKKVVTLRFAQIGVSREQRHGQARLLLLYPGHYLLRLTTVTEPHQEKSAVFFKLYPPEDQFVQKKPFYSKSINLILTRFFAFVLIPNET